MSDAGWDQATEDKVLVVTLLRIAREPSKHKASVISQTARQAACRIETLNGLGDAA